MHGVFMNIGCRTFSYNILLTCEGNYSDDAFCIGKTNSNYANRVAKAKVTIEAKIGVNYYLV